jgi:spore photoproduct lyase
MQLYKPERVFFDPEALKYPLGQTLYKKFTGTDADVEQHSSRDVARHIPGQTGREKYAQSKKTLFVTVRKNTRLDVCKPSADFEFSLVSNCPGNCEYCYLQTTQGSKPYLKVFVNLEDLFGIIRHQADSKPQGEITTFEVASLGDPLGLEHLTGSLAETIDFFGKLDNARLRVVTKYDNVDTLLNVEHNGHTRFRFSINSGYVIKNFEHNTASLDERLAAAAKMAEAGYPMGFVVAPIMIYNGWEEQYANLFERLKHSLSHMQSAEPVTFELIQHRFTAVAKGHILERFPNTKLDLDEENRELKWGRFGRYKYVYPRETALGMKEFIRNSILEHFPDARIEYFT